MMGQEPDTMTQIIGALIDDADTRYMDDFEHTSQSLFQCFNVIDKSLKGRALSTSTIDNIVGEQVDSKVEKGSITSRAPESSVSK